MDVVSANPEDWTRDPFTMVEEDGYLFGRGVTDNKFGLTMMVQTLIRLKQEGFTPDRDLVLALSGDEETQMKTTMVLAEKLEGADIVLNSDGGGGGLGENGEPVAYYVPMNYTRLAALQGLRADPAAAGAALAALADDAAIRAVLLDEPVLELARPGAVHVVTSTLSLDMIEELRAHHEAVGLRFVAAPVFGRPDVAEAGQLAIMAAGAADDLAAELSWYIDNPSCIVLSARKA